MVDCKLFCMLALAFNIGFKKDTKKCTYCIDSMVLDCSKMASHHCRPDELAKSKSNQIRLYCFYRVVTQAGDGTVELDGPTCMNANSDSLRRWISEPEDHSFIRNNRCPANSPTSDKFKRCDCPICKSPKVTEERSLKTTEKTPSTGNSKDTEQSGVSSETNRVKAAPSAKVASRLLIGNFKLIFLLFLYVETN